MAWCCLLLWLLAADCRSEASRKNEQRLLEEGAGLAVCLSSQNRDHIGTGDSDGDTMTILMEITTNTMAEVEMHGDQESSF